MAWSFIGGTEGYSSTAQTSTTVTHGQTINADDLVVIYAHANATDAMSIDSGGGTWEEAVEETPSAETAHHAFYWKAANGSEPSTYTVNHGSATAQIICAVFRGSAAPLVDAVANTDIGASNSGTIEMEAISGETISDNAVSICCGGKDNRSGVGGQYDDNITQSYLYAGGTPDDQIACMVYRIFTTGTSSITQVDAQNVNGPASDLTFSIHMSFLEDVATSIIPNSPFDKLQGGPFGGPF